MARLYYGIGRGTQNRRGFSGVVPKSLNTEVFRPRFADTTTQFMRKTAATDWTPMAFGEEGYSTAASFLSAWCYANNLLGGG